MSTTASHDTEPNGTTAPLVDSGDASAPDSSAAMTAARPPVGTGSAPLFGLLLALGLVALGVVGVQEALVRSGAIHETSWTSWTLTRLNGVRSVDWMLIVYVAAVAVGLLLLFVAFRRRPRKGIALRAHTGVYLRPQDLARVADSVIDGLDGVTDVNASASQRRLRVTVSTVEPEERNNSLSDAVRERLKPTLDSLERAPKVSITFRNEDLS